MKYFDENNQIIKAQQGLEFLRPKQEPVIDNAGGLGTGVAYRQMLIKQQQAKAEQKKRQEEAEQKKQEEARRPRAVLSQGRAPSQNSHQDDLDRMRQEQRSQMISYDPNGTTHMQASVQMLPYVGETTKQYFSRPAGEIVSGELRTLNHTLNPLMVSDDMFQAAREQSKQGNPLGAMGLGFAGFGLGALTASPVKTVTPAGVTATKRVAQGVKQATKTATENIGARMNAASEGFNSYSPVPAYQPYVFADGTVGLMPGNYNQMNFLEGLGSRIKGAWNGFKTKPTTTKSATAETSSTTPEFKYKGDLYDEIGNPLEIYREVEHPGSYWNSSTNQWTPFPQDITFNRYVDDVPVSEYTNASGIKFIKQPNGKYKVIDENGIAQSAELTPDEIQTMYSEAIPTESLKEYTSPDGKVFGRYRTEAVKGPDIKYEKVKLNEALDPTEIYYDKVGNAYSPYEIFYNSEGRPYKNWRTGELSPEKKSWWERNKGKAFKTALGVTTIGTIWGLNKIPKLPLWLWDHDYELNKQRQQQVNDSIQRVQHINDSIQSAQKDSADFNNQLRSSLQDLYRKADSLNRK